MFQMRGVTLPFDNVSGWMDQCVQCVTATIADGDCYVLFCPRNGSDTYLSVVVSLGGTAPHGFNVVSYAAATHSLHFYNS